MKLLFIGALPPPAGGAATWADNFINHQLIKVFDVQTVNTSLIGRRAGDLSSYRLYDEFVRSIIIWFRTLLYVIWFRPTIVHLNSSCATLGLIRDFFTICIARMGGAHLIFHCHVNVPVSFKNSVIGKCFLNFCLRFASKVLVLNEQSAIFCKEMCGIESILMPNFICESEISAVKSIADEIHTVIFAGHIIRTKGVYELFEVAKRFPLINFIMAGIVTAEIEINTVPENVKLIGDVSRPRLALLLRNADIFIFPTYTEGFSMALLEAMASGLPVITTPVGANVEMLEKNGGIIVPVGSVEGICDALNKLQSPVLRKRMSQWNIDKVRTSYTAHIVIGEIIRLYNIIVNNSRS